MNSMKGLDWVKVANIIKEWGPNICVYAGILEDWDDTCACIYDHGETILDNFIVSSTQGTPTIEVFTEGKARKLRKENVNCCIYSPYVQNTWTKETLNILNEDT